MRRKFIKEGIFSYCNGDYDLVNEQILENPFDTYCQCNVNVILNHWYYWLSLLNKSVFQSALNVDHPCRHG